MPASKLPPLLGLLLAALWLPGGPTPCLAAPQPAGSLHVGTLRCGYVADPLGVDTPAPRLSWTLEGTGRGLRQTAYRILVASAPGLLARGAGDLWDSGAVASDRTNQIAYAGKPLRSGGRCWWKVRVVDQAGRPSAWSAPARWTMGILRPADWQGGEWIGRDAAVGNAALIGYHASEAQRQDDVKWVQIDLGRAVALSAVRLLPMQHAGRDGFGFPLRFRVEAANEAAFQHPETVTDQSSADYPNPGVGPVAFAAHAVTARYVRVTATKLWLRDAAITGTAAYAFALRGVQAISAGKEAAVAGVAAEDSVESSEWGRAALMTSGGLGARTDSVLLRRGFTVRPGLTRAVAFVCGLGQYEMSVNGARVGDAVLSPGWTQYNKTCLYDTYDITAALRPGANAVGLFLGNGMYNIHPGRYTKITGSFGPQRAFGLLRLEYADGTAQDVVTDGHWKVGAGPITFSSIYGGEDYDARLAPAGWDRPGFDDGRWASPVITAGPGGVLRGLSCAGPPIRRFGALLPISRRQISPTAAVYDLGRNASLLLRLRVRGARGASVRVTPSELVKENGDIDDQMCGGDSYWTYTLSGGGDESYASRFYYRGGRYLKVETRPAPGGASLPVVEVVEGDVIHADAPAVGHFACSSERYNKTASLIRQAQLNNMVSILTDCPTREKLGWLEEDHLNGPALRYNFDMATLMSKMVNDMADAQRPNGLVPSTCPDYPHWDEGAFTNPPEWGSACIAVPWQQYEFDGDLTPLRAHYDTMRRYVDYLSARAQGHVVGFGLGDWYDAHGDGASKLTPIGITATAFYFYDSQTLARVAALLGRPDDAAHYSRQAQEILAAYNQKFFDAATDSYATGSQASNAFPLAMGMVEPAHRPAVLDALARDLQSKGPTAGEVSLRFVLESLADGGRSDLIDTTFDTDTQGYGLQVKLGKTSLTEGWNGGSSQDHFMFGQINEWFYRSLAGIRDDPDGPGFRKIIIRPAAVPGLTWAGAAYDSRAGRIVSGWKREGGRLTLRVSIPANTTATVYVPAHDPRSVLEGGLPVSPGRGVEFLRSEDGASVYHVGSGDYVFTSR